MEVGSSIQYTMLCTLQLSNIIASAWPQMLLVTGTVVVTAYMYMYIIINTIVYRYT